ncbi:MAG TPA: hypothetical protein VIY51_00230 [Xanthobacteraceae bacterium]
MPSTRAAAARPAAFYGWRVVGAAFVLAVFGWGVGFYGPPIFLQTVSEARGWPLWLVSAAVTGHFLVGAVATANLPRLYGHFGVPAIARLGALSLAAGIAGWAFAREPWQLFGATLLSGAGWVAMGPAAINAIIAPWFVRTRPAALAMAYNGASIGGIIFSPLWVAAIGRLGFSVAATVVGIVMILVVWVIADLVLARTPQQMGLTPDGDAAGPPAAAVTSSSAQPLPDRRLWGDLSFVTLSAGMAL